MALEPLTPDRRRQQTREYLLKAAEQVFSERGFHGATLDEVAAVAGFTKGAVYSNFKSKDDLFLALLEARYEREMGALQEILDATEGSSEEQQANDFVAFLRDQYRSSESPLIALDLEFSLYAARNPAALEKLSTFRRKAEQAVAAIIATQRMKEGLDSSEPPEHAARFANALMRGVGLMRLVDPEMVDEAFLQDLMRFLYRAMT